MMLNFIVDPMVQIYTWLLFFTIAGTIAFGHLAIKKKGLPCYMMYLTFFMFSGSILASINLYARYLRIFGTTEMNDFAFTPLWYMRWIPFCIITTMASVHVIYKNYIWKGYTGKNRRKDDRRGGIK